MTAQELFKMPYTFTSYGELLPTDKQKSFYGKAKVWSDNYGRIYLQSYDTIVAVIDGKTVYRTWEGYSQTTQKHIKSFLDCYAGVVVDKKKYEQFDSVDLHDFLSLEK